jgi:hypothetical protein
VPEVLTTPPRRRNRRRSRSGRRNCPKRCSGLGSACRRSTRRHRRRGLAQTAPRRGTQTPDRVRACNPTQPTLHGGHLFQGRYQGILRDAYLLELSRYVVLNLVRVGLIAEAADWPWSSYGSMVAPQAFRTGWSQQQLGLSSTQLECKRAPPLRRVPTSFHSFCVVCVICGQVSIAKLLRHHESSNSSIHNPNPDAAEILTQDVGAVAGRVH